MFEHTAIYRSLGLRLLPLSEGDKTPAIRNWQQRATADLEDHRRWFVNSVHNVGILCDKVAVVDTDSQSDAAWWEEHMPRTPWVVRTRKGKHFYYDARGLIRRNRSGVKLLTGADSPMCDLRAGGHGYVVAAHMIVRGHVYELLGKITLDLPQFDPGWLPQRETPRLVAAQGDDDRMDRRAQRYGAKIRAISGDGGHNATFRYVCWMRDTLRLSPDRVLEHLIRWNASGNAQPPWSESEMRHKVESAFNTKL